MKKNFAVLLLAACGFAACNSRVTQESSVSGPDTTIVKTAEAAFIYSLPLALMDITHKKIINFEKPVEGKGAPINQFTIFSRFPDADFKDVVRPNADTYYNTAILDLSDDAQVLDLPNTNGRYYLMPMLDAWTNVFESPGKRTTGTSAQKYLITGPKWTGTIPAGLKQIKSPTNLVWILGRFQVNSAKDGEAVVVPLEKKVSLTPLASYGKPYTPPPGKADPNLSSVDPNSQIIHFPIDSFFNYVNQLMVVNPPAAADSPALAAFAKIGVGPGATFKLSAFDTATQSALAAIPKKFVEMVNTTMQKGMVPPINGWSIAFKNFGNYGTNYILRALVAYAGLGANLPQDAIYPSSGIDADGNKLNGSNQYILHFEKGQTPPVNAFWSLTMYDNDGYFIHNPINRYSIGDRSNLKTNKDGSVDIYIQNISPGKDKESNWLPSPTGSFNVMLRMYWPKDEVVNGSWVPSAIKKVK
ncbi:MAG TPA: DUF1254 domain-containing protein [Puia sp.]|nr:DUF1254 domain-containing protein [Puia sp.]